METEPSMEIVTELINGESFEEVRLDHLSRQRALYAILSCEDIQSDDDNEVEFTDNGFTIPSG